MVKKMPVTKQYLRYVAAESFGVVCSSKAGAILVDRRKEKGGKRLLGIAPALENVIIWDLKASIKVCTRANRGYVT